MRPGPPTRGRAALARIAGAAVLMASTLASPLSAQDGGRATIRLDGRALLRVSALDTLPARERADRVERALERLADLTGPARASIEIDGRNQPVVSIAGIPLITVTPGDTIASGATETALAHAWSRVLADAVGDARARRSTPAARFATQVRGSVANAFARVADSALVIVPRVMAALLVLLGFWVLARGTRWLLRRFFRAFISDLTLESLVERTAYYTLWLLGAIVAVGALGLDPTTVATGLGLTGIALGFALKDVLSNFVSGLLILLLRPFRLGDQIVVGETEGTVERIELRATQIRTYDGRSALVPNAEVFTSRLINNTATPVRRGSVPIYLGYDANLPHALAVARDAAAAAAGVLPEPEASVRVRELTADDVIADVRFWTDSRRSDFLDTASAVRISVLNALVAAGVSPSPIRTCASSSTGRVTARPAKGVRRNGRSSPVRRAHRAHGRRGCPRRSVMRVSSGGALILSGTLLKPIPTLTYRRFPRGSSLSRAHPWGSVG